MRAPWIAMGLLLAACRPSQAQIDDLSRKLDAVSAQQAELMARMDASPDPAGSTAGEHGHAQLIEQIAAIGDGLEMVHRRLDDLEARAEAPAVAGPAPIPHPGRPDPALRYRVEVGDAHVDGRDDAAVTVVAWVDYQCPFSARVQPTLRALQTKYGKKLRIVAKHNPLAFHKRAKAAALAAEAAGRQGKFFEMHAKLFDNQKALEEEDLRTYARKLHLDMGRFERDMQDAALADKIDAQQRQGTKLGANGTPAFFINGRFLSGAQPQESFEKLVDTELTSAKVMAREGLRGTTIYEALMVDALESP